MEKQIKDATKKIVEYYQKPIHLIVEGADDLSKKVIIEGVAQTIPTKEVLVITVRPAMLDKLQNMYRGICNIHCKSLRNLLKDKSTLSSYAMLIVDDTESFVIESKTYSRLYYELCEVIKSYTCAALWFTVVDVDWQFVLAHDEATRECIKLYMQKTTKLFNGTYITFSNEMEKTATYMNAKLQSGEKIIFVSDKISVLEEISSLITDDLVIAVPKRLKKAKVLYEKYRNDCEYVQHTGLLPKNKKMLLIHTELAQIWQLKDTQVKTIISDYVDIARMIRYLQNMCIPKKIVDVCLCIEERNVISHEYKKAKKALMKAYQLAYNRDEFISTVKTHFRDSTGMLYVKCNEAGSPVFAINFCEFYRYIYLRKTGYLNSEKPYKHAICDALGGVNAVDLIF